ncbi:MAG: DUF1622 domain-containing protein [Candidatus Krumholzibacteriota bacterium]|nr:DUF1622 domain-containing protein [Candidatus Krumholzibacteriota bacterium]
MQMEILHYISLAIGIVGIAVIVWGVAIMLFRLLRLEITRFRKRTIFRERETLRHQLGSYLLLGLEFLIAADIIGTVTHPTLEGLLLLGGIVVIRTVISYFIDKEIEEFQPTSEES